MHKLLCGAIALVLATAGIADGGTAGTTDTFKDPLDLPALTIKRQLKSTQMSAVTQAGERLVAVGIRGLILVSDDGGKAWKQSPSPVSSDLLDVNFPTPKDGWIVGHDGVVLRTRDGGNSWEKQLDGRMAKKLLTEHFEALVNAGDANAPAFLQDTQLNYATGPEQALLSVWFSDAKNGFVCGSFGTLLATQDGGATWTSWVEKVDTSIPLHFYAIRGTQQGVFMVSEKGIVFRLDAEKQRFVAMETGYNGTLFSLIEVGDWVYAAGLRGNAFRLKKGDSNWALVNTGTNSTITAGTALPDGEILMVTLSGQLLSSHGNGEAFHVMPLDRPMSFAGITATGPDQAVVVGNQGVRIIPH